MIFRDENAQLFSHKRDILGGIVMNAFFTAENVDVMSEKIKDPDEIKRIKRLMK